MIQNQLAGYSSTSIWHWRNLSERQLGSTWLMASLCISLSAFSLNQSDSTMWLCLLSLHMRPKLVFLTLCYFPASKTRTIIYLLIKSVTMCRPFARPRLGVEWCWLTGDASKCVNDRTFGSDPVRMRWQTEFDPASLFLSPNQQLWIDLMYHNCNLIFTVCVYLRFLVDG